MGSWPEMDLGLEYSLSSSALGVRKQWGRGRGNLRRREVGARQVRLHLVPEIVASIIGNGELPSYAGERVVPKQIDRHRPYIAQRECSENQVPAKSAE